MDKELGWFIEKHMKNRRQIVPARLQTALALLERLRENASFDLEDHLASKGSSGLRSHETYGDQSHKRFNLEVINKNHGRRSSSLQDWGQELLDILKIGGLGDVMGEVRNKQIHDAQLRFVRELQRLLEQEPLRGRRRGWSAEAVIRHVLKQAEEKGKSGDVPQYLVGAKLMMRFRDIEIPVEAANKADRKSRADQQARLGDFTISSTVIEVAVGFPDEKHISQVAAILDEADLEVWLLTRSDRVVTWQSELEKVGGLDSKRVVVTSVEAFVGQNITELGGFSTKGKGESLRTLFEIYNTEWVGKVGTPGIRIECK